MQTQLTQTEKAQKICNDILFANPKISLDQFLDMVEYPAFLQGIAPKVIIAIAHQKFMEVKGN